MTVNNLIERLTTIANMGHKDDTIKIYDADDKAFRPVTGIVYAGGDKIVLLFSDTQGG